VQAAITAYADDLKRSAADIGQHGLSKKDFWDSGIFHGAIEKLRGKQAASTEAKRAFVEEVLNHLQQTGGIQGWTFTGGGERHDYAVEMPGGRCVVVEAKGCLDGNNTNIYVRPQNADEFIIWSLCQNPGADPAHNAWSGIHTRLGAEVIHRADRVDGLVVWDMLCGTAGRPCPKLRASPDRATTLGRRTVPPPCIYLFPRTRPEPRNNPSPAPWRLEDVKFLEALHSAFAGDAADVALVRLLTRRKGASLQRKTTLTRSGETLCESVWTTLRRAT